MQKRSSNSRRHGSQHQEQGRGRWDGHTITTLLKALGPVVYAVRTRDGLVKIGFTTDLANRYRSFNGMRNILAWQPGTLADEQAIHKSLDGLAARGREYYPPVPEVLAVVNDMRAQLGQVPIAS